MRLWASWVVAVSGFALLASACGDDEPVCENCVDAQVDTDTGPAMDAGVVMDAEPVDSGRDAGPRPDVGFFDAGQPFHEASCSSATLRTPDRMCVTPCPTGGLCVSTQEETFCVDRCDTDKSACLDGFSCVDIGQSTPLFVCVPPLGSCLIDGATFGTSCVGDTSICATGRETCQGDEYGIGYCTDICDDGVCPPGFRCGTGDDEMPVCLAGFSPPGEACGTEDVPEEIGCVYDGDCPEDQRCLTAAPPYIGICVSTRCTGCDGACRGASWGDVCVPDRCACRGNFVAAGERDLFAEALASMGLDRCSFSLSVREWVSMPNDILSDPYRLSFTNDLVGEGWRVPEFSKSVVEDLEAASTGAGTPISRAAATLTVMAELADRPAVRHAAEPIPQTTPLTTSVVDLITELGGTANVQLITNDAADVPMDLQNAMATVIEGIMRAHRAREAAFAAATSETIDTLFLRGQAYVVPDTSGLGIDPADPATTMLFNEGILYGELFGGAIDLLEAIDGADLGRFFDGTGQTQTSTATFLFNQVTPLGRIGIGTADSGSYNEGLVGFEGPWALLLDLGGNDDYRIAASANIRSTNTVSVLIDLGGDDRYGYIEVPHPLDGNRLPSDQQGRFSGPSTPISLSTVARQGTGRAGVGLLIDLGGGNDHYQSLRMAQGVGIFGVGALIDDGGDDTYLAEAMAQGAASFGLGLLHDEGGDDVYSAYTSAQGFAFARAVGVSFDASGSDQYLLNVGDPALGGDVLYPSVQRPATTNASLGQGMGFGRRADIDGDRAFMSGGLGVLLDAGTENDRYEASVFAQGVGYWFGTGILADKGGDDTYDGLWYTMASGAHMAVGTLFDSGGNDRYGRGFTAINISIAGAHDYSTAFLIDESGDDDYFGPRITLGGGNSSGRGVLIDNGGNDTYEARNMYAFGNAGLLDPAENFEGAAKRRIPSIGIFIDAGGTDIYMPEMAATATITNDSAWSQTVSTDPGIAAAELGAGIDAEGETTIHAP